MHALQPLSSGYCALRLRSSDPPCENDIRHRNSYRRTDNEEVELNKDEEYTEALMQEHLRRLLRLSERTYEERYLLQNLSISGKWDQ